MKTTELLSRLQQEPENVAPVLDTKRVGVEVNSTASRRLPATEKLRPKTARHRAPIIETDVTEIKGELSQDYLDRALPSYFDVREDDNYPVGISRSTVRLQSKSRASGSGSRSKLKTSTPRLARSFKGSTKSLASKSLSPSKGTRTKASKKSSRSGSGGTRADSAIALGGTRPGSARGKQRPGSTKGIRTRTTPTAALHVKLKARKMPESPRRPFTEEEKTLLKACEGGDLDAVYNTLWRNPDINCRKPVFGSSPLAVACRNGDKKIASILMSFGADIMAADEYGVTPLHWAANSGDPSLVSLILQKASTMGTLAPILASISPTSPVGPDAPNVLTRKDLFGSTPLHFASVNNLTGAVRALITAGSDPTALNNDGRKASELTTDDALRMFLQDEEQRIKRHQSAALRSARRAAAKAAAAEEAKAKKGRGGRAARSEKVRSTSSLTRSPSRKSVVRSTTGLSKSASETQTLQRQSDLAPSKNTKVAIGKSSSAGEGITRREISREPIMADAINVLEVEQVAVIEKGVDGTVADARAGDDEWMVKQTSGPRGFTSRPVLKSAK